ncbi:MAG: TonB-dependent receptor [Labilithrix sp.]|nr:TonB-dependent receptor [Labilithrix sp.]
MEQPPAGRTLKRSGAARAIALAPLFATLLVAPRVLASDVAPPGDAPPGVTRSGGAAPGSAPTDVAATDAAETDAAAPGAPADATAPPAPLEEVSVPGTRLVETGGSAHVLRDVQLRRFSYDDPHQVLMGVPGVYVRPEDGFGLRPNIGIRGANSDRSKKVTLMEDGILLGPAPYSAPAAYYFPMIDRMRTVRVVKGPASIVYGPQTVGGAIDLVTREIPSGRKVTYDLAFGQYLFNKQHVSYGSSDERAGFLIEGMRVSNAGFKELDRAGGDTGFTRNEWMAKGSYVVDPAARIQNEIGVKLGYSDEVSNETYLGLTDADARRTPDRRYYASKLDRMEWHRTAVAVTHKARFSRDLEMTTTVYRHDLSRVWRKVNGFRGADVSDVLANPDTPRNALSLGALRGEIDTTSDAQTILIGPNDRRFVSQGLQTQVNANAKTGPVAHRFTYGVRAHYDEIVRKHTQDGFVIRNGALTPDGRVTELIADNKASTHALALWAVDAMTFGPVTLTPGARIEAIHASFEQRLVAPGSPVSPIDGAVYQAIIPGASGYWAVTRGLGVLAGVHKGFSPVPPEQARTNEPEQSVNYETGARWSGRHARVEAIGFYNAYSNLTNLCTFSNGCVGANVDRQFDGGRARIVGAEIYGETELPLGGGFFLPSRLAYTYTYSEFLSTFSSADPQFGDVRRGDELPYVPPNQLSGAIGLEKQPWGLNVAGTFVDSMRERAGQGTPRPGDLTDAYFLLDASAKYKVFSAVELYVSGRNLLDDRYIASRRPFGARPGAPLWVLAGVRGEL